MCTNPIYPTIRKRVLTPYDHHKVITNMPLPCGVCPECLRKRQSAYAVRAYKESLHCKSLHFITLTYNDESCPVSSTLFRVDTCTGEMENIDTSIIVPRESIETDNDFSVSRQVLNALPRNKIGRCQVEDMFDLENYHYFRVISDSLDYSDIKNLFKRFRRLWEYKTGETPKFSYLSCGEYGKNTSRPHYHLLLWNLTDEQVEFFCSLWKFGFFLIKRVKCSPDDFLKVSQYVAKYVVKPAEFVSDIVRNGYCLKPRVHSSLSLGVANLSDSEISYYRAYDLFGRYDIYCPQRTLTQDKICKVAEKVSQRLVYYVGDVPFALPKTFVKRLFRLEFGYKVGCWSEIYVMATEIARNRVIGLYERQYKEFCTRYALAENSVASYAEFERYKQTLAQVANSSSFEKFRTYYGNSKF